MKRTLAILGLLVCTTGVVMAEETSVAEFTAPQQVEVQSQLDKQTFDNSYKRGPKFDTEFKNVNDKVKYDKSVKDQRLNPNKTGKQPKFDKKTGYRGQRPDIRNDRFNPNFNARHQNFGGRRHEYMGHHRRPHHSYKVHRHQYSHMRNHKAHNRIDNRRAYNKSIKRR